MWVGRHHEGDRFVRGVAQIQQMLGVQRLQQWRDLVRASHIDHDSLPLGRRPKLGEQQELGVSVAHVAEEVDESVRALADVLGERVDRVELL